VQYQPLDLGDMAPAAARSAIRDTLAADASATRRVYAALARKVWTLLVERRFDPEIRDWLVLLNNVRTAIRNDDPSAAERVTALADLMGESVSFAELSPAAAVAERPRARTILERLAKARGYLKRRELLQDLAIGSSHLSNVLTQLQAHDLVRRRGKGKEAEFEITQFGRKLVEGAGPAAGVPAMLFDPEPVKIADQLRHAPPIVAMADVTGGVLWTDLGTEHEGDIFKFRTGPNPLDAMVKMGWKVQYHERSLAAALLSR
jgi:predicted transcriptional regulator